MKYKLENTKLNEIDKSHLTLFFKYFEDIKNYEKSFENYSDGNKIIKKLFNSK